MILTRLAEDLNSNQLKIGTNLINLATGIIEKLTRENLEAEVKIATTKGDHNEGEGHQILHLEKAQIARIKGIDETRAEITIMELI